MISEGTIRVLAGLADGATTWAALHERTGLSESCLYASLEKLREAGVISQTAIVQDGSAMSEWALRDGYDTLGAAARVIVEALG